MFSLQDKLDDITQRTRALVQPERLRFSEQTTADLFATGIEDGVLPAGAPAPEFTLADARTGRAVRSSDLLSLGPLVIDFFRGRWCPYCITELEAWRDLYPELRRCGALLVAISPQTPRQNSFTLDQLGKAVPGSKPDPLERSMTAPTQLPFPILSDPNATVAERFGLAHTVPEPARRYYRSILVNIPFANSGRTYDTATPESWRLPLPATFVVTPDGRIAFAEAHADFRVRPEPAAVLEVLRSLPRRGAGC